MCAASMMCTYSTVYWQMYSLIFDFLYFRVLTVACSMLSKADLSLLLDHIVTCLIHRAYQVPFVGSSWDRIFRRLAGIHQRSVRLSAGFSLSFCHLHSS